MVSVYVGGYVGGWEKYLCILRRSCLLKMVASFGLKFPAVWCGIVWVFKLVVMVEIGGERGRCLRCLCIKKSSLSIVLYFLVIEKEPYSKNVLEDDFLHSCLKPF